MSENTKISDVISITKEIKLGSKTFKIKDISLISLSSWQEWCLDKLKDTKKKESKEKIQELIDIYKMAGQDPDVKELIKMKKEYDDVILAPEDSANFMNTIDGICYLIQLNINDNNDEKIDIDFVKKNIDINEAGSIVEFIMHELIKKSEEGEDSGKNQTAKSQSEK